MSFVDKELTRVKCCKPLVFSVGEQAFFHDKGFVHTPKRSKQCKADQKQSRSGIETKIQCAECGIDTTVPFKPHRSELVFRRTCFLNRGKVIPSPGRQARRSRVHPR